MVKKKNKSKDKLKLAADAEPQMLAFPEVEAAGHQKLRERFYSRRWWTLLLFQSEVSAGPTAVFNILADIDEDSAVECETVTWPVVRIGERSGRQEDAMLIIFINKASLPLEKFRDVFRRNAVRVPPALSETMDALSLSQNFSIALLRTFDRLLKVGSEADN